MSDEVDITLGQLIDLRDAIDKYLNAEKEMDRISDEKDVAAQNLKKSFVGVLGPAGLEVALESDELDSGEVADQEEQFRKFTPPTEFNKELAGTQSEMEDDIQQRIHQDNSISGLPVEVPVVGSTDMFGPDPQRRKVKKKVKKKKSPVLDETS